MKKLTGSVYDILKIVEEEEGQWISNIFLRPKPNGKFRMILDLSELNKMIHYNHGMLCYKV